MPTLKGIVRSIRRAVGLDRPGPATPPRGTWLRARYDAAKTTDQNKHHWADADGRGPNATNSPADLRVVRNRARHEAGNNGYAKGLLRTIRNDVIGTGPRLQVTLPATYSDPDFGTQMTTPPDAARAVERRFRQWLRASGAVDDLRVLHETADRDGECFGVMVSNPAVADPVNLALRLFEAEQVSTPDIRAGDPLAADGIRFDGYGNPVEYHFLKQHPGEQGWAGGYAEYDRVPAGYVFHWYDPDRPNQRRGVSALVAGLGLFGQLRRYTGAVLSAAETAANHAAVLTTDQPPPGDDGLAPDAELPENFDRIPMPQNGAVTLPAGWSLTQFDPTQPTTTYAQFKGEVLTEIGAGVNVPEGVSTKSSAKYNFSSARLDRMSYQQGIRITRERMRAAVLDRLFRAWHAEASLIPGHLPAGLPPLAEWEWAWQWDGWPSIDPAKDATADDVRMRNGTATLADILADQGKDWDEHLEQRAKEMAAARQKEQKFGLPPGSLYPAAVPVKAAPPPAQEVPADAEAAAA